MTTEPATSENGDDSQEINLMMKKLTLELSEVQEQLAYLTHRLAVGFKLSPQKDSSTITKECSSPSLLLPTKYHQLPWRTPPTKNSRGIHPVKVDDQPVKDNCSVHSHPPAKDEVPSSLSSCARGLVLPSPSKDCLLSLPSSPKEHHNSGTLPHKRTALNYSKLIKVETPPRPEKIDSIPLEDMDTAYLLRLVEEREEKMAEYKKNYLSFMQKRIKEQLKRLSERATKLQKAQKRRKRRETAEKLKRKPVRFRSSGADDKNYLNTLYQSRFYKIVGEEHKLKKTGQIKTTSDLKEFWDYMLAPDSPVASPRESQGLVASQSIWEEEEEEEDSVDSWAITALPPVRQQKIPVSQKPSKFTHFELKPLNELLSGCQDERVKNYQEPVYRESFERKHAQMFNSYQRARANEMAMRSFLPQMLDLNFLDTYDVSSPVPPPPPPICPPSPPSSLPLLPSQLPPLPSSLVSHHSPPSPPPPPPGGHQQLDKKKSDSSRITMKSPFLKVRPNKEFAEKTYSRLPPLKVKPSLARGRGVVTPPSVKSLPSKPMAVPLAMTDLLKDTSLVKEVTLKRKLVWTNYAIAGN